MTRISGAISKFLSTKPMFLVLLVILLIIARSPKFFFFPAFWGEEGNIFYLQQMTMGLRALTTTYAGYLHMYPRMIALLCAEVPVQNIPYFFHAGSLLAHVLLLYSIFRFTETSPQIRPLAALATVIIPHSGEVFLNLPNTISVLAPIIPLLYFSQKTSLKKSILEGLLIAIVMLSGPYGIIQLPFIFAAWCLQGFNRQKIHIILICIIFAGVQLAFMDLGARAPRETPLTFIGLFGAATTFIYYLFFAFFGVVHEYWLRSIVIVLGLALSWSTLKKVRVNRDQILISLTLILAGGAIWGAAVVKGLGDYTFLSPVGGGGRYFWPPYVLVCIGLIYLLKDETNKKALKLVCILVFLSTLPRWPSQLPGDLPGWREEILNSPPGPIKVRALPSKEWTFPAIKK